MGTQTWLWQAGQGTSTAASSDSVQSCNLKGVHCLLSLFSPHLYPLESLVLCLLFPVCPLPEVLSPWLLSPLPTLLPQEQPCP